MLNWNEVRTRAQLFVKEWEEETRERGEYQIFWEDFFNVFGIKRRSVAVYQHKAQMLGNHRGFIDLFWPGMLLVEHKSVGKDLDAAFSQAIGYIEGLKEEEKPRYVIVTDYNTFRFYDLEGERSVGQFDMPQQEFSLGELPDYIRLFAFIAEHEVNVNQIEHYDKIAWEDVKFVRGAYDGHLYRLEFTVAERKVVIHCSDIQIINADFILGKMEFAARKIIDCPFKDKQRWKLKVVFPWLEHISMSHAERESKSDVIQDIIRDFASKPIWKETYDKAFYQTRDPVREDQTIFMPFSGLKAYVRRSMGADTGDRFITTTLYRMGANKVRRGKNNNTFYALNYDQLENPTPSGTGIGENNADSKGI